MLTTILCLLPFALFGLMAISFYNMEETEKKNH